MIEDIISVRQLTVKRIYQELIKTKIEKSRAEEFGVILWKLNVYLYGRMFGYLS